MTGFTAEGQQAYAILDWANEDPPGRAAEAQRRVDELARSVMAGGDSEALSEVRDAGTVITRLAGAVSVPAAFAGIAGQLIDLARFDPARHPRGAHGKFVKSGTVSGQFARALAPAMARGDAGTSPGRGQGPAGDINSIVSQLQGKFAPAEAVKHAATQEDIDALEARLRNDLASADDIMAKVQKEQHEADRAELVLEALTLVGGLALAFFLGGGVIAIAALAPFLIKTAIEKGPDLAMALAKYHVVGKGKGRSWFAHPVAVPAVKTAAARQKAAVKVVPKILPKVSAAMLARHPKPSHT